MRETLEYTTIIDGQEVTITRYPPSNGKGLYMGRDLPRVKKKKKTKPIPVDKQLHALETFLAEAKKHDTEYTIKQIESAIERRIKELTHT